MPPDGDAPLDGAFLSFVMPRTRESSLVQELENRAEALAGTFAWLGFATYDTRLVARDTWDVQLRETGTPELLVVYFAGPAQVRDQEIELMTSAGEQADVASWAPLGTFASAVRTAHPGAEILLIIDGPTIGSSEDFDIGRSSPAGSALNGLTILVSVDPLLPGNQSLASRLVALLRNGPDDEETARQWRGRRNLTIDQLIQGLLADWIDSPGTRKPAFAHTGLARAVFPNPVYREGDAAPVLEEQFSASILQLRDSAADEGDITASRLAQQLAAQHPEYANSRLGEIVLDTTLGPTLPIQQWLSMAAAEFDLAAVRQSSHQVLDGRLVLLGLAQVDPDLSRQLDESGVLTLLRREVSVLPIARRPTVVDFDVGFVADRVGDRGTLTAEDDKLGIEDDVRTLSRLVLARSTEPPLAVGLFGDWGAGKSFFLDRMRGRITQLSREASESAIGTGMYEHPVQVTFNAWHYLDSDLWASMADRLYTGLAGDPDDPPQVRNTLFDALTSTRAAREQAARAVHEADRRRVAAEARRDELEGDARKARELLAPDLPLAREIGQAARQLPKGWWMFVSVIVVVAGIVTWVLWARDALDSAKAITVAAVPPALAIIGVVGRVTRVVRRRADDARQRLRETAADLESARADGARAGTEFEAADATLRQLRQGQLVRHLLHQRVETAAFRDRLGIVHTIREDLEVISARLDPKSPESAGADIDRVILYVDDLDRCPPQRVVEVLQAVHLLLAFPLFVVVVAVDHRWLTTCLELHYRDLLGQTDGKVNVDELLERWELTPSNYLEKIFQIPLVLKPMSKPGYENLMKSIAPTKALDAGAIAEPPADEAPSTDPQGAPGHIDADPASAVPPDGSSPSAPVPSVAATPLTPTSVFSSAVDGQLLDLAFSADGTRVVIATTAGAWRWDRGRQTLTPVRADPLRAAAVSGDGGVIALVGSDVREVRTLDLRTGEQRSFEAIEDVHRLAVSGVDHVWDMADGVARLLRTDGDEAPPDAPDDLLAVRRPTGDDSTGGIILAQTRNAFPLLLQSSSVWATPDGQEVLAVASGSGGPRSAMQWQVIERSAAGEMRERRYPASDDGTANRGRGLGIGVGLVQHAARSLDGWWLSDLVGSSVHLLRTDGLDPEARSDVPPSSALAADPHTSWLVAWDDVGFSVFDATGLRYIEPTTAVEAAAVSPRGSLIATFGAGTFTLWRVVGADVGTSGEQLQLEPEEGAYLNVLRPLIPTPRVAKRLVNVYRYLRASAFGRSRLADPTTGDFRAALLLLAVVVGRADAAETVLREVEARSDESWPDLLARLRGESGHADGTIETLGLLTKISESDPPQIALLADWVEHVARFHVPVR